MFSVMQTTYKYINIFYRIMMHVLGINLVTFLLHCCNKTDWSYTKY